MRLNLFLLVFMEYIISWLTITISNKKTREWMKTTSNANKLKFHTLLIYDLHFYHSKSKLCNFKS
jgi:hypothetical protein